MATGPGKLARGVVGLRYMAPPPPKRLLTLDGVENPPEWLEPLLGALNAHMRPVAEALDKGLSYGENFLGQVVSLDVTPPDEWEVPTMATGWSILTSGTDPQGFSYRKTLDGVVEMRGRLDWTGGGTPSSNSVITTLPVGFRPAHRELFAVFATDGASAYDPASLSIESSGQLKWTGTATGYRSLSVSGCVSWVAADGTPPRWSTPITVKLGAAQKPFPGSPKWVIPLGAVTKDSSRRPSPVRWVDAEASVGQDRRSPVLRVHRVWGLSPGVGYTLTLLVLPE